MTPLKTLAHLPVEPGVYLMKGARGKILYIGKAKNLKARVRQYFAGTDERPQIPALIAKVETIETVVVRSEKEALLLENTLIKQHKPPYNIFLKDDKGYIRLQITDHPWPMIQLIRTKATSKQVKGQLFGPYTSTLAARQMLELLTRLFPLRRCSDRELARRTRPCILYQMKRCVAPCVDRCSHEEYDHIVHKVAQFLSGKDQTVIQELKKQMNEASQALEFERAAELLELIHKLEATLEQQQVDQAGTTSRDVIGLYREGSELALSQMFFRSGRLTGAHHHPFQSTLQEDASLLASFLLQHYAAPLPEKEPLEILLPVPLENPSLIEEVLRSQTESPLHLHAPQRGDKKALLEMANANARASFHQERDLHHLQEQTLMKLQESLGLVHYPRHIECVDTSNLSGSHPTAALIAFLDGEKERSRYRKYRLQTGSDDYAGIREVLTRRLTQKKKEEDLPDLLIVDGGKGHLQVALQVLANCNLVTVDVIALAKEEHRHDRGMTQEQIFLPGRANPLLLSPRSQPLFLLQRIRDEAHRFAITYQKKRRSQETIKSVLDRIPGIGPTKKKRLLQHFGSAKKVFAASKEELSQVKELTQRDIATLLEIGKRE